VRGGRRGWGIDERGGEAEGEKETEIGAREMVMTVNMNEDNSSYADERIYAYPWRKTHLSAAPTTGHSQAHHERDGDVETHAS